jgi:hypothetical protein
VLTPCPAGELTKWKVIVVLPFDKTNVLAGLPFTLKSLASRVAGSMGSLRSRTKSTGSTKIVTVLPQLELSTEQAEAVSDATPSRNAIVAMINVAVRVITPSLFFVYGRSLK